MQLLRNLNLFYLVVFLYFFTLVGDKLNIPAGLFKIKVNNFLALMLLTILLLGHRCVVIDRRILLPALWILVSLCFSACASFNQTRSFGYCAVYLFEFFCYFIIPFNLVSQFDHERIFSSYWRSFKYVGFYACAQLFLSIFGIRDPLVGEWIGRLARPHAFAYEPSYYALYMCAWVMFINALYLLEGRPLRGRHLLTFLGVNFLLFVSTSTGAFFSYFIFFAVILGITQFSFARSYAEQVSKRSRKMFGLLSLIIAASALILVDLFRRYFFKFFVSDLFEHGSFAERWQGIKNSWSIFLEHPWLGVGLGGIGPYLYNQKYKDGLPSGGVDLTLKQIEPYDPTNAFTEVLGSLGLFGLFGFLWLGTLFFSHLKQTMELSLLPEVERSRVLALAISLIVMLIVLQFNQGIFRSYIWVHTAISWAYLLKLQRLYEPVSVLGKHLPTKGEALV